MTGFNSKREAAADKLQEPEREALKLALITLEGWDNHDKWVWPETALEQAKRNTKEAITAIKEALALPAQEPVGFMNAGHVYELQQKRITYGYVYPKKEIGASVAVYTTPPQREWVGLTAEEIASIPLNEYTLQKAEKLLKEKNT